MKKIILPSILIIVFLACVMLQNTVTNNAPETTHSKKSDAYEALNFQGARQMYPENAMPSNAYFDAWQKWKNLSTNKRKRGEAPWESLGPANRGGRTLCLAMNPQNTNTIFAGSASGGLWKSNTAGVGSQAWQRVNTGYPTLGVSTIAFHPTDSNIMYIGTGEVYNHQAVGTGAAYRNTRGSAGMGILKSTDGGQTWSISLNWTTHQERGIWMIKVDPQNSNTLYAATTLGVYKSTNAGSTWDQILNVVMATDILIHPSDSNTLVAACGNFLSAGYGIYKSQNGGNSWQQITSNLPTGYEGKIQLGMAPSNPEIIYASIGNGFSQSNGATWLCRSTDFGTNWTIRNTTDYSQWQGWFAHDVAVSPTDPDDIVAIGIKAWRSTNGGANLTLTGGSGGNSPVHADIHDVQYDPTDATKVYLAHDGGISRSTDGGTTWTTLVGGYQTLQFYNGVSTSQLDTNFMIGGLQDNGTIQYNGTQNWSYIYGGDGSWTAMDPVNTNAFYVSSQRLNMRRTTNGGGTFPGMNWSGVHSSLTSFIAPFVVAPSNGQVVYSASSKIGKSTNMAVNWTAINGNVPLDGNPVLSLEVAPQNESVLYAGTAPYNGNRGHLFVSQDGNTFTDVTGILPDRYPMDITVDPTDPATAYVVFSGFGSGHIFRTTNYGTNWTDISDNLPDVPTNAVIVDPIFPNHIYVGNDLGIFVSTIGGTQWASYSDGLPNACMIFDLKISEPNRKLRAATHGNGAYQRDLLQAALTVHDKSKQQTNFNIFPNPAVHTATIQFENNMNQNIEVELLDLNGRLLKTISNGLLNKGTQELIIDVSEIHSGIYFIRLTNEEGAFVKRLVKQ